MSETERSTIDSVAPIEEVRSLARLRQAYAAGRLRPSGVAEAVLEALSGRGDDHVWITTVAPADLRRRAADLDAQDPRDLPLYGVPFAVKDNIDVAAMPTTAACPDFAYVPERTAPVVQRLLDAGALLVGKTNLDQFATGLTGSRSPHGAVESVFGGGLISGGSSSGSAVAVAAGVVTFALGTDTAGSGRVPAALNGIVGVKPTRGLLSTRGVVPACRSLDCVSIFAADVAGATAVADLARAVIPGDPRGRALPPDRAAPRTTAAVRLGLPRAGDLEFFGDTGQAQRYAAARRRAAGLVADAVDVELEPFFEAGDLLYGGPWVAERLADLGDFLRVNPDAILPVTRRVLAGGHAFSAADAFRGRHRLTELRAVAARLFERVDALLLPTIGTTYTLDEIAADPIGRNLNLGRYTQFANMLDMAAVTIPNGFTADGRPASVTLLGPAFSDETLALLATDLQPVTDFQPATDLQSATEVTIAVVGRHLHGESRNSEILDRGAELVAATRTAGCYRLYRLPTADGVGLPGLVRCADSDSNGGSGIEVELWRLPAAAIGGLLAGVPAPLSLGWVRLADGRDVIGFLCEAYAVGHGAEDITDSGGWRNHRAAVTSRVADTSRVAVTSPGERR